MAEPAPKRQKLHGRAFYESLGSPKLVLAPMVDQSEFAWRLLSRSFFPPEQRTGMLAYSPMLHARMFADSWKYRESHFECRKEGWEGLQQRNKAMENSTEQNLLKEARPDHLDGNLQCDRPLIVQFCANDPQALLSAAKLVQPYCDAVDLNLGCPQGIAKRGHYGAFLQEDQPLIADMVRTLHAELDIPVTAKMRVLETKEKTLQYAKTLLDAGASILTVHGRRREMKGHATGVADWKMIRHLRQNLPKETVIFANGNILQHGDIQQCLDETGVDGVMSAEGNLYDPSIFAGPPPRDVAGWVDVKREYWTGREGKGGYRVDAVLRRYLDIVHRHALGREPPERKPLFVHSDLHEEDPATAMLEKADGTVDLEAHPSAKRSRTVDSVGATEPNVVNGQHTEESDDRMVKRQKPSTDTLEPTNSHSPADSNNTESLKMSKKQRKAAQKKTAKLALALDGPQARKPPLEHPNSPNIVAMQAHCFHILRPLVSQHHNVRDALARCRAGDIAAYETVLTLTEAAVKEGLLAYAHHPAAFEDAEEPQDVDADDTLASSTAAVRRCRRPFWVCQAYVRPLPHEALEKGSLQLSKKEKRKLEEAGLTRKEVGMEVGPAGDVEAAKSGVPPEGRLVTLETEVGDGEKRERVLVEGEGMVAG